MATIRLIPSTYYLSNTSYLSVTNESNLYSNTDSNEYATVYNNRTGTNSYYIYLRGFNFDDVPAAATVNSFSVKLKAYESGVSTSASYQPQLADDTTTMAGSGGTLGTTVKTITFTGVTASWDTIKGYGDNFGIRINCRRANRNTAGYVYIYGAEIEVDYTLPVYYDVSVTNNSTVATVEPTATQSILEGGSQEIKLYVDNIGMVSVTDNGVDITSSFSDAGQYYSFVLSNISATHSIVIEDASAAYLRRGDKWRYTKKFFKKVSGAWVEITRQEFSAYVEHAICKYGGKAASINTFTVGAPSAVTAETCQCIAIFNDEVAVTGVNWAITSGSGYATISSNGLVAINSSAAQSQITVQATYETFTATVNILVTYKSGASSSTETQTIENEDGTTTTTTTTTTDNGDGSSTSTSTSTTYDENGDVQGSSSNETTNNADGSSESITTNYDAEGNETGHETQNTDTSNNVSTQTVEKDENGNDIVTNYTIDTSNNTSGEGMGNDGSEGIDTQFIPFDGSSAWELNITARFDWDEQDFSGTHATLVNLMKEVNPWPGMVIRYESTVSRRLRVVVDGNGAHATAISEPSDSIYSLRVTYQNKTITIFNKLTNTTVESYEYDLDSFNMVDTTVRLFASYNPDTGSEWRYGTGSIYDFSIRKLE